MHFAPAGINKYLLLYVNQPLFCECASLSICLSHSIQIPNPIPSYATEIDQIRRKPNKIKKIIIFQLIFGHDINSPPEFRPLVLQHRGHHKVASDALPRLHEP